MADLLLIYILAGLIAENETTQPYPRPIRLMSNGSNLRRQASGRSSSLPPWRQHHARCT